MTQQNRSNVTLISRRNCNNKGILTHTPRQEKTSPNEEKHHETLTRDDDEQEESHNPFTNQQTALNQ